MVQTQVGLANLLLPELRAMAKTKAAELKRQDFKISAPNFQHMQIKIIGTAPYVQNRMSSKQKAIMRETQEKGRQAKSSKKREPKDFNQLFEESMYKSHEGWRGINASCFRNAMISACRATEFVMTHAKLAVFVTPDGFDQTDGTPLVKITKGEPQYCEHAVRNATGVADVRPRAMWQEGWEALVSIKHDADMLTAQDVTNLMSRVGVQVGIGEGRPDSKKSAGIGFGTFELEDRPQ